MSDAMKDHDRAKEAMRRYDELKELRTPYEEDWDEIARYMRPQRGGFRLFDHKRKRMDKVLSSEPMLAQSGFAAGIYAALTNPAQRWGGLETPDMDFNNWKPMAEWIDHATSRVMASFSPSVSPFYSATFQAYSDLSAFGNAASYDQIDTERQRFIDVTMSLAEIVVSIDAHGAVNEFVRKFSLKPRAAVREYGDKMLPPRVVELAENGATDDIWFYYHVVPNDQFVKGQLGPRGKRFLGVTACEIDKMLVKVGGHDEMPAQFPRWDVDSGMTYGTGPGAIALPSARTINLMDNAQVTASQFAANPTKLVPDRQAVPLNGAYRPGAFIYGGVDMRGNQLVRNMEAAPNIGLTIEEKRAKVEAVQNAFYFVAMSMANRTGITDEETRIMEEARLRNWAPNADRCMEEYAAPKFQRRFNLLWRAGQINPPPKEAEGRQLRVRYQSSAAMAMRSREGAAVRQFLADLGPLAQLNPRYIDRVDPDATAEALHDASPALPAAILRSREEADQIAEERAQRQQQAEQMQMLREGGAAARDLAQAAGGVQ